MELLLLLLLLFFDFCIREAFLMENFIDFSCLLTTALEYPFCVGGALWIDFSSPSWSRRIRFVKMSNNWFKGPCKRSSFITFRKAPFHIHMYLA